MLKWEAREGLETPERRIEAAERLLGFILAYDAARRGEFRVAAAPEPVACAPVSQPPWTEVLIYDAGGKVASTFRHGLSGSLLSVEATLKEWLWSQLPLIQRLRNHGNRLTVFP